MQKGQAEVPFVSFSKFRRTSAQLSPLDQKPIRRLFMKTVDDASLGKRWSKKTKQSGIQWNKLFLFFSLSLLFLPPKE